ncbi:MAG TPA: acyl-CoA thioesterase [Kofleriaceae bacterium]|nr:acyl-CoA thioesterase [Kofleriaceae bacterium]
MNARHTITLSPVPADIDELDHVSNLVYVRWILEVALSHSGALGWDHAAYRRLGAVFVVRRHEIDYLQSVVLGDEVRATTWVESWKQVSCVRKTELVRAKDAVVVARASTTWAFIDYGGKPRRIPAELLELFTTKG